VGFLPEPDFCRTEIRYSPSFKRLYSQLQPIAETHSPVLLQHHWEDLVSKTDGMKTVVTGHYGSLPWYG